jgi:hypothetical protein
MFRLAIAAVVSLCAATASAQSWADKMFTEDSFDFGAVPRSAKVEHAFVITNPYQEDIHIAGVSTSCGCTEPRILKDTLKTHETGAIVAAFNTRGFSGQRSARLTVTIDRPQWANVELNVKGYIRTDVVLEPGQVKLGSVPEGGTAGKKIQIEHYGRDDWQLTGVTSALPYLQPSLKELSRSVGLVVYELDVQLTGGAPAGYLNDELIVTTNDRRVQFPVIVEGRIVAPLTVSPTALMLGTVVPGQKVVKQIVVRATEPFAILDVRCDDGAFSFNLPASKEAKTVHLVPVAFQADEPLGKFTRTIEIVTDLGDGSTAELTAIGHVSAPLASK